jgi:hypothetical protein
MKDHIQLLVLFTLSQVSILPQHLVLQLSQCPAVTVLDSEISQNIYKHENIHMLHLQINIHNK